ncbi:hypothetical protein EP331_00470 [bacterium]|nr:MAG: hypothetical protein EP331_00470 [bacterium]
MKRYLAFYGNYYYPNGGMYDFLIDCDTIEECEKAIQLKHKERWSSDTSWEWDWKQIWDSEKREFIVNIPFRES